MGIVVVEASIDAAPVVVLIEDSVSLSAIGVRTIIQGEEKRWFTMQSIIARPSGNYFQKKRMIV